MIASLRGVFPILPAPFDPDGRLDLNSFRRVVESQVLLGAHGVVLFGLVTEYYKLTDAERDALLTATVQTAGGRLPVVVSITDHATVVAVERAKQAVDQGADALMVMPPYFLRPGRAAALAHIRRLAGAVAVPVIVQYSPAETGIVLEPEDFLELQGRAPNVAYVKVECSPSGPYISRLAECSGSKLGAFVGYAGLHLLDALARGGVGVMPSTPVVEVYRQLFDAFIAGDNTLATSLHQRLLPLISTAMQTVETVIAADKLLLQARGIIAHDAARQPAFALDGPMRAKLLEQFAGLSDLLQPLKL